MPNERRCCKASLLLHAGLWGLASVLGRTDAARICETQTPETRGWLLSEYYCTYR